MAPASNLQVAPTRRTGGMLLGMLFSRVDALECKLMQQQQFGNNVQRSKTDEFGMQSVERKVQREKKPFSNLRTFWTNHIFVQRNVQHRKEKRCGVASKNKVGRFSHKHEEKRAFSLLWHDMSKGVRLWLHFQHGLGAV